MALITGKDEYITCPYEKSHQILINRIQFHLVKCQNVNKNARLVECPYNATHKIREPELKVHMNYLCDDRGKVDKFVCKSTDDAKKLFEVKEIKVIQESSENWDNEQEDTYNPEQYIKNAPVLVNLQGVTPSERKQFRAKERLRVQQLKNGMAKNQKSNQENQPLRLPSTRAKTSFIQPHEYSNKSTSPENTDMFSARNGERDGPSKNEIGRGIKDLKSNRARKYDLEDACRWGRKDTTNGFSNGLGRGLGCGVDNSISTAFSNGTCNGVQDSDDNGYVRVRYSRGRGRGRLVK